MNTEQIMALVDAYAERVLSVDYFKRHAAQGIGHAEEMAEIARKKVAEAIESLQNRDDWK